MGASAYLFPVTVFQAHYTRIFTKRQDSRMFYYGSG